MQISDKSNEEEKGVFLRREPWIPPEDAVTRPNDVARPDWDIHKIWLDQVPVVSQWDQWPIYDEKGDSVFPFMLEPKDGFDRLVKWGTQYKYMKWFKLMYHLQKEFLLYALMGLGTIIISIHTYQWFSDGLGWPILIANAVSWIFATMFAFLTNRKWVFTDRPHGVYAFFVQMWSFFGGRLVTLGLEEAILYIFVDILSCPNMLIKYIAQVIVILTNYFISKWFVFKSRKVK